MLCLSNKHTAAWDLRKEKQWKNRCKLRTRRLSRTNTFRLGSTIITCTKKDGTYSLVVDYRRLKILKEKSFWPLPRINVVIDSLEGNIYFSNIDLLLGYFQMATEEENQNWTAFITPLGLYRWKWLPMGLACASGAFQNLMELTFADIIPEEN